MYITEPSKTLSVQDKKRLELLSMAEHEYAQHKSNLYRFLFAHKDETYFPEQLIYLLWTAYLAGDDISTVIERISASEEFETPPSYTGLLHLMMPLFGDNLTVCIKSARNFWDNEPENELAPDYLMLLYENLNNVADSFEQMDAILDFAKALIKDYKLEELSIAKELDLWQIKVEIERIRELEDNLPFEQICRKYEEVIDKACLEILCYANHRYGTFLCYCGHLEKALEILECTANQINNYLSAEQSSHYYSLLVELYLINSKFELSLFYYYKLEKLLTLSCDEEEAKQNHIDHLVLLQKVLVGAGEKGQLEAYNQLNNKINMLFGLIGDDTEIYRLIHLHDSCYFNYTSFDNYPLAKQFQQEMFELAMQLYGRDSQWQLYFRVFQGYACYFAENNFVESALNFGEAALFLRTLHDKDVTDNFTQTIFNRKDEFYKNAQVCFLNIVLTQDKVPFENYLFESLLVMATDNQHIISLSKKFLESLGLPEKFYPLMEDAFELDVNLMNINPLKVISQITNFMKLKNSIKDNATPEEKINTTQTFMDMYEIFLSFVPEKSPFYPVMLSSMQKSIDNAVQGSLSIGEPQAAIDFLQNYHDKIYKGNIQYRTTVHYYYAISYILLNEQEEAMLHYEKILELQLPLTQQITTLQKFSQKLEYVKNIELTSACAFSLAAQLLSPESSYDILLNNRSLALNSYRYINNMQNSSILNHKYYLKELQNKLTQNTAIIEFSRIIDINDSNYCVYIITTNSIHYINLCSEKDVDPFVDKLLYSIKTAAKIKWSRKLYNSSAYKHLQEQVINPWLSFISDSIKSIVIIPEGYLAKIPFEIFQTLQGKTLGSQYNFSYSFAGHSLMKDAAYDFTEGKIVIGAPCLARYNGEFEDLPAAVAECQFVAKVLDTVPHINKNACENLFRTPAGIMHIATHSFNRLGEHRVAPNIHSAMENIGIVLSDTLVCAKELSSYNLYATKLLVMSICGDCSPVIVYNEGVVGNPQALMAAGAQNIICNLWESDDMASMVLMHFLYGFLNEFPPSTALQKAKEKLRMLNGIQAAEKCKEIFCKCGLDTPDYVLGWESSINPWNHPFYWGGYICFSNTVE